jgi:hypothetical protein
MKDLSVPGRDLRTRKQRTAAALAAAACKYSSF